jgi:hypothetical protein
MFKKIKTLTKGGLMKPFLFSLFILFALISFNSAVTDQTYFDPVSVGYYEDISSTDFDQTVFDIETEYIFNQGNDQYLINSDRSYDRPDAKQLIGDGGIALFRYKSGRSYWLMC